MISNEQTQLTKYQVITSPFPIFKKIAELKIHANHFELDNQYLVAICDHNFQIYNSNDLTLIFQKDIVDIPPKRVRLVSHSVSGINLTNIYVSNIGMIQIANNTLI